MHNKKLELTKPFVMVSAVAKTTPKTFGYGFAAQLGVIFTKIIYRKEMG